MDEVRDTSNNSARATLVETKILNLEEIWSPKNGKKYYPPGQHVIEPTPRV